MEHERKPRPGSIMGDDERVAIGARHRTPRAGTPQIRHVADLAAPVAVDDEDSAAYDVPERQERRERRPTPNRIRKLEAFKDDVLERLPKLETNVQYLVDAEKERRTRADKRREWWSKAGLLAVKGIFSSGVIVAVLRGLGVL